MKPVGELGGEGVPPQADTPLFALIGLIHSLRGFIVSSEGSSLIVSDLAAPAKGWSKGSDSAMNCTGRGKSSE